MSAIENVSTGSPASNGDLHRLRDAVGQAVGSVFFGTLLKTMRSSDLTGKYGHGGRGEEVFAAQLDSLFASEIGKRERGGLTDALYKYLEAQQVRLNSVYEKVRGA